MNSEQTSTITHNTSKTRFLVWYLAINFTIFISFLFSNSEMTRLYFLSSYEYPLAPFMPKFNPLEMLYGISFLLFLINVIIVLVGLFFKSFRKSYFQYFAVIILENLLYIAFTVISEIFYIDFLGIYSTPVLISNILILGVSFTLVFLSLKYYFEISAQTLRLYVILSLITCIIYTTLYASELILFYSNVK